MSECLTVIRRGHKMKVFGRIAACTAFARGHHCMTAGAPRPVHSARLGLILCLLVLTGVMNEKTERAG